MAVRRRGGALTLRVCLLLVVPLVSCQCQGCVINNGKRPGMCFATGAWEPALSTESLTDKGPGYYRYGTGGRGTNDTFTVPIVTVIDPANDVGVSLVRPLLSSSFSSFSSLFLSREGADSEPPRARRFSVPACPLARPAILRAPSKCPPRYSDCEV